MLYIEGDRLDDTRMRWEGCIARVDGSFLLMERILQVNADVVHLTGELKNVSGWMPIEQTFAIQDLDLSVPKTGYVNYGKSAYFFRLVAKSRMYKLGLINNRVSLEVPNKYEMQVLRQPHSIQVPVVLEQLYNRTYMPIAETISKILNKEIYSAAVSLNIALGISRYTKQIGVYRNNALIGEVNEEAVINLVYKHKFFKEELEDLGFTVNLIQKG